MGGLEVILNLWYVVDDLGMIYSLRARCYVYSGTDEEKLAFLQSCAETDFLVAQPFPIPERLHATVVEGNNRQKMPVASHSALQATDGVGVLFEEVFEQMEKQLPAQTKLSAGRDPLVCITPLLGDGHGNMRPLTTNTGRL
jgi:hypothetical protein